MLWRRVYCILNSFHCWVDARRAFYKCLFINQKVSRWVKLSQEPIRLLWASWLQARNLPNSSLWYCKWVLKAPWCFHYIISVLLIIQLCPRTSTSNAWSRGPWGNGDVCSGGLQLVEYHTLVGWDGRSFCFLNLYQQYRRQQLYMVCMQPGTTALTTNENGSKAKWLWTQKELYPTPKSET